MNGCIKIAGILLIIPGFVTDLLGLILLVKSLRGMAWSILTKKTHYKVIIRIIIILMKILKTSLKLIIKI